MKPSRDGVESMFLVLTAIVGGLLLVQAGLADETETVTIHGTVEAADYNDDGEVTAVAIYDREWGSVLVSSHGVGPELLEHVDAYVSATGQIRELDDPRHPYTIDVASYTLEEEAQAGGGSK